MSCVSHVISSLIFSSLPPTIFILLSFYTVFFVWSSSPWSKSSLPPLIYDLRFCNYFNICPHILTVYEVGNNTLGCSSFIFKIHLTYIFLFEQSVAHKQSIINTEFQKPVFSIIFILFSYKWAKYSMWMFLMLLNSSIQISSKSRLSVYFHYIHFSLFYSVYTEFFFSLSPQLVHKPEWN